MKRVQDDTIDKVLGLDPKSRYRNPKKLRKLLFRKSQLDIFNRIGLAKYAAEVTLS